MTGSAEFKTIEREDDVSVDYPVYRIRNSLKVAE